MSENIITIKLLPKQLEFVQSKEREVMYVGAFGAGKSLALGWKLAIHAAIPGNFCLLTRKTRRSLTNSTLRTLLVGEPGCPAVLQQGSYEFLESKSAIRLFGGGEIAVIGCDDDVRLRSINAGCIAIDEAIELTQDEYEALLGRLRNKADPNRQLISATNPSGPHHHLYRRFIQSDNTRRMITANMESNFFLPPDYVAAQKKLTGAAYQRYVEGKWAMNEGRIYSEFTDDMVKKCDPKIIEKIIIGIDVGFNDPTAIAILGIGTDESINVLEEVYSNQLTPSQIIKELKNLCEKYAKYPIKIVCDPSAKGVIVEGQSNGVRIEGANNSIPDGIRRVKQVMAEKRFFIDPVCTHLLEELDMYAWKSGKTDVPADGYDHMMDALRYATNRLMDSLGEKITPSIWTDDDADNEHDYAEFR